MILRLATALLFLTTRVHAADVAIVDTTLVDVERGVAVPHTTVVARDGTISALGPADSTAVPAGAERVDGRGRWLIPGLWDLHVHTLLPGMEDADFPLFVANGVLGVRDMHTDRAPEDVVALRDATANGTRIGPRLIVAGALVDGPHAYWTASFTVRNPAEARNAVRKIADNGMDFVKPYDSLEAPVFRALAAAAREAGVGFAGHVPLAMRARDAAAALDTIEHVRAFVLDASSESDALRAQARRVVGGDGVNAKSLERWLVRGAQTQNPERLRTLAQDIANLGPCVTPTLVVGNADGRDRAWSRTLDTLRYVPVHRRERWVDESPRWRLPATARRFDAVQRGDRAIVRALHEAGVTLLAGTDAGNPFVVAGFSLHDELAALVESGLGPLDALRAATTNARRCLGNKAGSRIAIGARAELVLLDADPLADIRNTRRIRAVVLGARYFNRADLDALLATAERRANTH